MMCLQDGFPTKALGYKQIADPIEKFKDVG